MKKYKIAVFGATVLASAIAEKLKDEVIVIEKSESVAIDYVSCINMTLSKIDKCSRPETKDFFEEMRKRNLVDGEGRVHIFPVSAILAKSFWESNILLSTDVISVEKKNEEYEIKIFNIDGFSEFRAEYIIDTTATGIFTTYVKELNFKKYINAAVDGKEENDLLQRGRFENEFLFSLQVDKDSSYDEAVRKLHERWKKLFKKELQGFKITAIAPQLTYIFDKPVEKEVDDKYIFKPSASFGNLGEAYEEGINVSELFI